MVEKHHGFSETDKKSPNLICFQLAIQQNFTKMLSGQQNLHQTMLIKCLNYLVGPSNPCFHLGPVLVRRQVMVRGGGGRGASHQKILTAAA